VRVAPLDPDDPIDFLSEAAVADPHSLFHRVRAKGPVVWSPRHRAWVITGHPELEAAFRDPRLTTERMAGFRARQSGSRAVALERAIALLDGWMLFHEPPTHTRMRSPLARQFTPRAVADLTDDITGLTRGLLDDLAKAGRADLVEVFAHPLPAAVIGRLFGVPDDRQTWLAEWSSRFGVVVFGAIDRDDYEEQARAAGADFQEQLGDLMERYRAEPCDNLLSLLMATEGHPEGLSTIEILGACSLILFAGHDTTASLLGSATLALLADPVAAGKFRVLDSDEEIAIAIEELLRLEAPAKSMMREVTETHERSGQQLAAGDSVFMTILGANHDPRTFEDPDRLHLDRQPNPHLTFGDGHHICLGAHLARLEARIALGALFRRFPDLRVDGEVTWSPTIGDRSARRIPVAI
jgi:cytochrome P450